MMVTSLAGRSAISVVSEPISLTSSSFTILMTICPGFSPFMTSCPTACSCTDLINCFTTLKLTSASRSAILTSFSAVLTSAAVRRPLLLRFLKTFWSFSVKLSNAMLKAPLIYPMQLPQSAASHLLSGYHRMGLSAFGSRSHFP